MSWPLKQLKYNGVTQKQTHAKCFKGLTLVELIMALAIFSILAGFGVPMVSNMIAVNEIKIQASETKNVLTLARTEAITQKTYITLCARQANANNCLAGAKSANWQNNGWILFRDQSSSGSATINNPDSQIIQVHSGMKDNFELTITGNPAYIRFTPMGSSSPNTTFRFCLMDTNNQKDAEEVIISSGRVRTESGVDTGC